jgi:hypothetical protein
LQTPENKMYAGTKEIRDRLRPMPRRPKELR